MWEISEVYYGSQQYYQELQFTTLETLGTQSVFFFFQRDGKRILITSDYPAVLLSVTR